MPESKPDCKTSDLTRDSKPKSQPSKVCRIHAESASDDQVTCPIHHVRGVEKKQKWFCPVCGMLLQTCCD